MADVGVATIINEDNQELTVSRPDTRIYVSTTFSELGKENTETKNIFWTRIERTSGRPGRAYFTVRYEDENNNTLYIEDITKDILGISLNEQIADRIFVLILLDLEGGEKEPLFLGYFDTATITFADNDITIEATSLDGLLDEKYINGKYGNNNGTLFDYCPACKVIFNKDNEPDKYSGKYFFDDRQDNAESWNCYTILQYIEYVFGGKLRNDTNCWNKSIDYPQKIGVTFDNLGDIEDTDYFLFGISESIRSVSDIKTAFENNEPVNLDISGMTIREAIKNILKSVGNYQIQFKIMKYDDVYRMLIGLTSTDVNSDLVVKHNIKWGTRGGDINIDLDFEDGNLMLQRNNIRKVIVYGDNTLLQVTAILDWDKSVGFSIIEDPGTPTTLDLYEWEAMRIYKDWSDTIQSDWSSATDDQKREAKYNDVWAKYKIYIQGEWILSKLLDDLDNFLFYKTGDVSVYDYLLTEQEENTKETVKGWLYNPNASQWKNIQDLGFNAVLRKDKGGIRFTFGSKDTHIDFGDWISNGNSAMVLSLTVITDDRARGVAGLDSNNNITTNENDIIVNNDDQILIVYDKRFRNEAVYRSLKNYDTDAKQWEFYTDDGKDKYLMRDDRTAISDYAYSLMQRQLQLNNSGYMMLRGWKTSILSGDFVRNLEGSNRNVKIDSWIESIIFDNIEYRTEISLSKGLY